MLPNFFGDWIERPQPHVQMLEQAFVLNGRFGGVGRNHKNGPVGKVTIPVCLRQPFSPIGQFHLKSREPVLHQSHLETFQRQRSSFAAVGGIVPRNPDKISNAEARQRKMLSANARRCDLLEVGIHEFNNEIGLGSFAAGFRRKIQTWISRFELQ
jgi:hypothetical protein